MAPKFMVTGSAGFIGSTLARRLLTDGAEVVGVDCLTDAYDPTEKQGHLEALTHYPQYRHIGTDLVNVELGPSLNGVEGIFHLAGRAGVRDSFGVYPKYSHDNIDATRVLVEAARLAPSVKRLVYASSSSVYGNARLPLREDSPPNPISPYGRSKLEAERICLEADGPELETVALRYFTVYGPSQRPDMALRRFLESAITGHPVVIFGDGRQTRDFTFVDDIVAATRLALTAPAIGRAINVGGGSRISVRNVLALISDLAGRDLEVSHVDVARGDVRHTEADLTRATETLGFHPKVGIREGLKLELDWLRMRMA